MVDRVLVFHAKAYDFVGRDGDRIVGNKVQYFEAMEPAEDGNEKGVPVLDSPATSKAFCEVVENDLPAVFEFLWGRRPGKRGKPEPVISGAKFVSAVPAAKLVS